MSIVHSNITTPAYSIAQQETVQDKSQTVNHVNNVRQISWHKPEEGSLRWSNQNVHIVRKRTLEITSSGRILREVHRDWSNKSQMNQQTSISDHRYAERVNKSSRSDHRDIEKIKKPYLYAQAAYRTKAVYVRTSRLMHKSCICMHKPLNAQKPYTYAQSA